MPVSGEILELALPVRNPSDNMHAIGSTEPKPSEGSETGSSFNEMMLATDGEQPPDTRQSANADTPNIDPELLPDIDLSELMEFDTRLAALDTESASDKALQIEIELFVGQMLKQIEFPEQSTYAVDALTKTLSEFIHEAMKAGGIDVPVPEAAAGDLPVPEGEAELIVMTAPALPSPIKPADDTGTHLPNPVPASTQTVAEPTADVSVSEAEAEETSVAKPSPTVQQQSQPLQQTMAATAAPTPERQQIDFAPIEAHRETREGDRQQLSTQRDGSVAPDLSRMQRVNTAGGISQHHNGILIADTGNKTYEIRFNSVELGQIRVELQMDGSKPEASVIFNNQDAEKPLRDLFGSLQSRMASLGIENMSLRQDTGRNPGGEDASGGQGVVGEDNADGNTDATGVTYYIAPDMTEPGRLDIRF